MRVNNHAVHINTYNMQPTIISTGNDTSSGLAWQWERQSVPSSHYPLHAMPPYPGPQSCISSMSGMCIMYRK